MTPVEEWRVIPGYDGAYEVSNIGRVRSWKQWGGYTNGTGALAKEPRMRKPRVNRGGYMIVNLLLDGVETFYTVHRLVAAAFIGPRPEGAQICHADGNPANNRVDNLRYDTAQGNADDRLKHGTVPAGESHPLAKLSEVQVREIRERAAAGESFTSLGARYGVARSTAARVAKRKGWANVA